ncbi:hypothetical protein CPB86DRAFT_773802 [Serendipita vermifera]|nr:hypothetical protein CPB86DRAFT_773802 [Serendipita vermifera]
MDISPSSILLIPVGARLSLSVLRYSFDILFVEPSNAFLFCMALGILSYKTIMYSSLLSGVMVGLGSRALITYIAQGRRWTVVCGFLLGVFASDVVTLFWTYVNQESIEFERQRAKRLKREARPKRRISDPRPPNPNWRSSIADSGDIVLQAQGLDKDTVVLMRKTASAEAEVKRLQEERKWAISQGNTARAMQLKWQVERSEALLKNYRKELEEKRASQKKPPSVAQHVRAVSNATSTVSASERGTPNGKRVPISEIPDGAMSDTNYSDPEHVRMHTREHLTQRFTLEDGSEVQLTQLHLGRNRDKEPERPQGRSVPITIIDSPIQESTR